MGTWFDTLPPELVDAAGGADRFGLWMRHARMHLDTLPGGIALDPDPRTALWQDRYEAGWSPRQAAFAEWNSTQPRHAPTTASPALPTPAGPPPAAGTELG